MTTWDTTIRNLQVIALGSTRNWIEMQQDADAPNGRLELSHCGIRVDRGWKASWLSMRRLCNAFGSFATNQALTTELQRKPCDSETASEL
ncbi:MAG: hypothetical protein RIS70_464 [Planctomycetota bacterium]